jgi:phage protein D
MKSSPIRSKQKLSPQAARDKAARDLAYAKTPARRAKKAENQRKRRAAKKRGVDLTGKDYDHTKKKFVPVKANRGGHGKGTKK